MESISMRVDKQGRLFIGGDLYFGNAVVLFRYLQRFESAPDQALVIDLYELDIFDGKSLAMLVRELRGLRRKVASLVLVGAPQMLGHNLYRINLLSGAQAIELEEMREDEAYG